MKKEKKKEMVVSYEPEVVEVVRKMIAPDLNDSELKVYLGVCRKYKADPIMKNIIPIVFNTKRGRVLNFIITRDFLLRKAHESGVLDGMHSKIIKDKGAISGAEAEAWKKGSEHSFKTEVDFKEYYNTKNELWAKFPGAMIKKVAEVIVLKQLCGIDMPSNTELEKNGESLLKISDIEIPKRKLTISVDGKVRERAIKKSESKEETL